MKSSKLKSQHRVGKCIKDIVSIFMISLKNLRVRIQAFYVRKLSNTVLRRVKEIKRHFIHLLGSKKIINRKEGPSQKALLNRWDAIT